MNAALPLLNHAIVAVDEAAAHPDTYPDPIAIAVLRKDRLTLLSYCEADLLTKEEIEEAIAHAVATIPPARIQAILKKWGGK